MRETIKEWIIRNEAKMLADRIAKLEEMEAPEIMVEMTKNALADLEAGNLKIGGDKELLNTQVESFTTKTGRGGKTYVVINDTINYFPNARYGRYIKRGE